MLGRSRTAGSCLLGLLTLLLLGAILAGGWAAREPILAAAGRSVVREDPPAPADLVAIVGDLPILGALEAAALVKGGSASRVLLFRRLDDPEAEILAKLRIPAPRSHEVARMILVRLGVPAEAITVVALPGVGTNESVRALARHADERGARRLIVVTHRSHTRRVGRLLRGELPPQSTVIMRASPQDPYHPERWWRDRASARELALEALRWLNSFGLDDFWRDRERATPAPVKAWGRSPWRTAPGAPARRTPG